MKKLAALAIVLAACGGAEKKAPTTPGGGSDQSMQNTPAPSGSDVAANDAGGSGAQTGPSAFGGSEPDPNEKPVTYPDLDPDPNQAKSQVDQHLAVARAALSAPTPDPDTALREAKAALAIDAASVDAAAYVAFAYYHKHQYDTAELVLDDVFKRPSAKNNAGIYYVYGLVYDHTNRPEQAVMAFTKAVELNPNFASALVDVGVHELENKQYAKAQETFEKLTKQFNRNDAITLTSLASAYRGHAADYPVGSADRNGLIVASEATYRKAIQLNPNYGPAYFDLALLYLDADPFPSGGGTLDAMQRLNASKDFLDKYKTMPGVDMKLYDERMKDVTKAIKREEKKRKQKGKGGSGGKGAP